MLNKMRQRPCPHNIWNNFEDTGNNKGNKFVTALDCDKCPSEMIGIRY